MSLRWLFTLVGVLAALAGTALWVATRPSKDPAAAVEAAPAALWAASFRDVDGRNRALGEFQGRVLVLNFWATWCAPCREEIPVFKDLHARYGSKGLTLIGIAMDDEGATVVGPFVQENGMPYVNLLGNEEVATAWGPLRGLPTKFLLDKQGRIVDTFFGPVPPKILEKKIQALL